MELSEEGPQECREKITRAKAQTEFNLITAVKDNTKHFYKNTSKKSKTEENLHVSLDAQANI